MNAPDLRLGPPRRWNVEIDGIAWLPRLIDKTRAALAGTLGTYLYGQSPIDRQLLTSLQIRYRDFSEIVRSAASDQAVVEALAARDPQALDRARAWTVRLPNQWRTFLVLLDVDDGYKPGLGWAKRPVNWATDAFCNTVKAIWPSHAIKPRS